MKAVKEYFVRPDNPVLIQIATPVNPQEINSPQTISDIEKLLDVAYGEQIDRNKPLLVGLAAPQIGISKRIILVDVAANGKGKVGNLKTYINPEIVWKSTTKEEWYEGCYSTDCVCGIVARPDTITIKAFNKEGIPIEETHKGYTARIFQHEIDHLNGKEFVSHITDGNNLHWVEDDEFSKYRNNEEWRNWPKKCPRKKWEKIKGLPIQPA